MSRQRRPSVGFVLFGASWAFAAVFVAWGARTPELDRLNQALAELELDDVATAPAELVEALERRTASHPELASGLARESGARILESQRDGWGSGARFHVVLAAAKAAPRALLVESQAPARFRLSRGGEVIDATAGPSAPARVTLPARWAAGGVLLVGERLEGRSPLRVTGITARGQQP